MTLERKTPLKPGKPLAAGKPLARKTPLTPAAPKKKPAVKPKVPQLRDTRRLADPSRPTPLVTPRPSLSGPNAYARAQVARRDGGRCVRCGAPATNVHHRKNRGMGGRRSAAARAAINALGSLLSLCGSGTTGCHGWVTNNPSLAAITGYVIGVNSEWNPATVPVECHDGWFLFDDEGRRRPTTPPAVAA